MARKDISDLQVLQAYIDSTAGSKDPCSGAPIDWPEDLLMKRTGQCEKVCLAAMLRAEHRGLIESGVSIRSGFLTDKGKAMLSGEPEAAPPTRTKVQYPAFGLVGDRKAAS